MADDETKETEENEATEETKETEETEGLSFKTSDELSSFLMDLQGQIANIQETVDKIKPVEGAEESAEETEEPIEEASEDEISEIDRLLQGI